MAFVAGYQAVAEVKRGPPVKEIRKGDHSTLLTGFCVDFCDDAANFAGE